MKYRIQWYAVIADEATDVSGMSNCQYQFNGLVKAMKFTRMYLALKNYLTPRLQLCTMK